MDLRSLKLNWVDRKIRDVQVKGAITGITVERTIEGASTITLVLRDIPDWLFREKGRMTRIPGEEGHARGAR